MLQPGPSVARWEARMWCRFVLEFLGVAMLSAAFIGRR
jgi:hypothetical protein